MQEKIANLEIKIFYDSAITEKGREFSKPQHKQRVQQDSTDGTARVRGVTSEQVTRKGTPHSPKSGDPLALLEGNFPKGGPDRTSSHPSKAG